MINKGFLLPHLLQTGLLRGVVSNQDKVIMSTWLLDSKW